MERPTRLAHFLSAARSATSARRRPVPNRLLVRIAARCGAALLAIVVLLLGVLAAGTAVGRFGATAVDGRGAGVRVPRDAVAVVVPVRPSQLREGDTVVARVAPATHSGLFRVQAVDSWTHAVYARDGHDKVVELKLGHQAGRVSRVIPHAATPFRLLTGTTQGIVLVLLSALLVARAAWQRRRRRKDVAAADRRERLDLGLALAAIPAGARPERIRLLAALVAAAERPDTKVPPRRRFGGRWWIRMATVALSLVGILAMTASANFTATATTNQTAIGAGHMGFTLPAAGGTYRLETGASTIATGDLIERSIDLQIDGTTSAGIMQRVDLQVSASSTAGDGGGSYKLDDNTSDSLRFWVQSCSVPWTTTDVAPYTYTACGGVRADVIGSYGAATALPTAGTCPYAGVSSVNAVESVTAMSNITLTASAHNYLVVFMCLPTATGNNYQNASATFTYTFTGVQRSATNK